MAAAIAKGQVFETQAHRITVTKVDEGWVHYLSEGLFDDLGFEMRMHSIPQAHAEGHVNSGFWKPVH